jgi:hypothetical protein
MKKSEAIFGVLRVPLDVFAMFAALMLGYRLRQLNLHIIPGLDLADAASGADRAQLAGGVCASSAQEA